MNEICCYGEIVWDIFPDKKLIGGAPLNCSLRLHTLGNKVEIISAVGNDSLGDEAISYIKDKGLSNRFILTNNHKTGTVLIDLDKNGNATYDIKNSVSWDFIHSSDLIIEKIKKSNAFIYGSLSARNSQSKKTLFELIEIASFNVFDLNLRAPFYNFITIKKLLNKADFIKFNEEEIIEVSNRLGHLDNDLISNILFVSKFSNTEIICVTRGNKGALLYYKKNIFHHDGFAVKVVDTIGSGDSFLAMLVNELLKDSDPEESLKKSCAIGAMVASKSGANPEFKEEEIKAFIESY